MRLSMVSLGSEAYCLKTELFLKNLETFSFQNRHNSIFSHCISTPYQIIFQPMCIDCFPIGNPSYQALWYTVKTHKSTCKHVVHMHVDAYTHAHLHRPASKPFNTQPIAAANQYKARDYACATLCRCMHVGVGVFECLVGAGLGEQNI